MAFLADPSESGATLGMGWPWLFVLHMNCGGGTSILHVLRLPAWSAEHVSFQLEQPYVFVLLLVSCCGFEDIKSPEKLQKMTDALNLCPKTDSNKTKFAEKITDLHGKIVDALLESTDLTSSICAQWIDCVDALEGFLSKELHAEGERYIAFFSAVSQAQVSVREFLGGSPDMEARLKEPITEMQVTNLKGMIAVLGQRCNGPFDTEVLTDDKFKAMKGVVVELLAMERPVVDALAAQITQALELASSVLCELKTGKDWKRTLAPDADLAAVLQAFKDSTLGEVAPELKSALKTFEPQYDASRQTLEKIGKPFQIISLGKDTYELLVEACYSTIFEGLCCFELGNLESETDVAGSRIRLQSFRKQMQNASFATSSHFKKKAPFNQIPHSPNQFICI